MAAIVDTSRRQYLDFAEAVGRGERHLACTLIAVACIAILGAIVVPLSLPRPLPTPTDSERLATRYVDAVAAKLKVVPTHDAVQHAYGATGGATCAQPLATVYGSLATPRPGAARGTVITPDALLRARTAIRVYCPDRTATWDAFTGRQRLAATRRAQLLRARAAAAADSATA